MELGYFILAAFGFYFLYIIIHAAVKKAITDSKDLIASAVIKALHDSKNPENNTAEASNESIP